MGKKIEVQTTANWEYHRGLDYAVVMLPGESTDAASISIHAGDDAEADKLGRLIAAAPDLLEALRSAFAVLKGDTGAAFRDLCPATWRAMEAAISKAEQSK